MKMTDYKYEAYRDGNLIRIKPCNTIKTGKVYGQPNNIIDFVVSKTKEGVANYADVRINDEILNSKIRIRKSGEEPRLAIFKDEYYDKLGRHLTHSFGLKTRDEETIDSKIN